MNQSNVRCEYSADVNDWISWGGDPTMWCILLRELGIDGNIWRCPHAAVAEDGEGKTKCVFHLAPEYVPEDEDTSLALHDVLAACDCASAAWSTRLKQFIGGTFSGLSIDGTLLEAEENSPLYLIGSTFIDGLTISGEVQNQFCANLATFKGQTDFSEATFQQEAGFQKAMFEGDANFQGATFKQEVNFREATFAHKVDFTGATFKHRVTFRESIFQERVNFDKAEFDRRVVFSDANFTNIPDFKQTKFQDGCQCCSKDPTSIVEGPAGSPTNS